MLFDPEERAVKELTVAKVYPVQAGHRAADGATQTARARGSTKEVGLGQTRQALGIVNVPDGANKMLMPTIVQRLLKGDTKR